MSPYFDGCYFDPTYFDAAPCGTSGGGRRYRFPIVLIPDEPEPDDGFLIALTL